MRIWKTTLLTGLACLLNVSFTLVLPAPGAVQSQNTARRWQANDYTRYDAAAFFALPQVQALIDPAQIDYPLLHAAVFYASNEARAGEGLPPFQHSAALEQAAAAHSQAMTQHNFFSHTSVIPGLESMKARWHTVQLYGRKHRPVQWAGLYIGQAGLQSAGQWRLFQLYP
ncbi:MAG: hypothetical protein IGS03_03355 [Candidatus Sericytochromatia bacterium]|nr:hypothetical protein [Candidatus Sericytochromatia bacterium]